MSRPSGLQFTARIGDFPPDVFVVVGFELTETLSCLFRLSLDLASTDPDIAVADVLEQPTELTVWQDGEPLRQFTGVVSEFGRGDTGHHRTRYQLLVEPPLWRLGLMHNSRMFQTQTTDIILRTLLNERGVTNVVFDLKRPPEEREYCVQYRESDLAFIHRLAAEEGWHYRFDLSDDQLTLIIADHHGGAPQLEDAEYNASPGGSSQQPVVFQFSYHQRVRVAAVALKDYTYKNPAYALMHEQIIGNLDHRDDYQHYDYPGRFKVDASGKPFTRARLDALRNDASEAKGQSNRPDFAAGSKMLLVEHDQNGMNQNWLLTAIVHTGKQPQALEEEGGTNPTTYSNEFRAVPATGIWRPHISSNPRMDGPQIAIVTGPEGEEIHCDDDGRVKVRFPWDRYSQNDEHSSAWLRVSQGWAGGQYGFMALPRVGNEVIVSFLNGDPDQPIITGRTYHATNKPPYALPEHKTRTVLKTKTHKGEGSNELRFEDEANKEQIYIHAEKDLDLLTQNNRTEVISNDSHLTVENELFSQVKNNDHLTVDGEKRHAVGGDCSHTIGDTFHQKTAMAMLSEAGIEAHHKAGVKVVLDAGAELTIAGGGSFIKLDPSGVTLSGPGIKINSGGSAGNGSGQGGVMPIMPNNLPGNKPGKAVRTGLADVEQRDSVEPSSDELEPERRQLIVEIIGGDLEQDVIVVSGDPASEGEK